MLRPQELLDAIQRAIEQDRARRDREQVMGDLRARLETLTRREREVMALAVAGRLNKQIAAEIGLSEATVKLHREPGDAEDGSSLAGRPGQNGGQARTVRQEVLVTTPTECAACQSPFSPQTAHKLVLSVDMVALRVPPSAQILMSGAAIA